MKIYYNLQSLIIPLMAICFLISSCKKEKENDNPSYSITFTVTDGINPIEGATVYIDGIALTATNGEGKTTTSLINNKYTFKVSATGYHTTNIIAFTVAGSDLPIIVNMNEILVATSLELVSGGNQMAVISSPLADSISVIVKDQNGNIYQGIEVDFGIVAGVDNGNISSTKVITNLKGKANIKWTLGNTVGIQTLTVTAVNEEGIALSGSPIIVSASAIEPTIKDIQNNTYRIVTIGRQIWMAENLRTTYYADGTPIQHIITNSAWIALNDGNTFTDAAYCWYDNDSIKFASTFGALYTWAAAMGAKENSPALGSTGNPSGVQGVCPAGWHLPSFNEWAELYFYLAANGGNYDKTVYTGNDVNVAVSKIGKSMADSISWKSTDIVGFIGNNVSLNNSSGFSARANGCRIYTVGYFGNLSYNGGWWNSTEYNSAKVYSMCQLSYWGCDVATNHIEKSYGFGVRCVKNK